MKDLIISGYSKAGQMSVAKYKFFEVEPKLELCWYDNIVEPTFLSLDNNMIFAICREGNDGMIVCYRSLNNSFIKTDTIRLKNIILCHIYYSKRNKTVYVSSYKTGHIVTVLVENYKFIKVLNNFVVGEAENKISRTHCSITDLEQNRLFAVNISLDRVYCYDIDKGFLKQNTKFPYLQLNSKEGPRHIRFNKNLNIAYIITEYSNKILVVEYNKSIGGLNIIQEINTLPNEFKCESYCSNLTITSDSKYIYAANRGANTISTFKLDSVGKLEKIQGFSCFGVWPRHIELTNDDKFLIVANQYSNNVSILSVSDGKLKNHLIDLPFIAPSYIAEVSK